MSDAEVGQDPRFTRGLWMLEHQIKGPDDLIQLWAVFGNYAR